VASGRSPTSDHQQRQGCRHNHSEADDPTGTHSGRVVVATLPPLEEVEGAADEASKMEEVD